MKKLNISAFNRYRGADELIIYNKSGENTGTNAYGCEAVVGMNGVVVQVGSNDRKVPVGGFVISGHGIMAQAIKSEITVGTRVVVSAERMEIEYQADPAATKELYRARVAEIQERFENVYMGSSDADIRLINDLMADGADAAEEGDFTKAKSKLDQAYCRTASGCEDEVRAVWHRPREHSYEQVDAYVKRFKDAGFNLMLIETNYEGYSNTPKLKYDYLPPRKGYETFDVIQSYIDAGKKYGVKIHAWLEDFFFGVKETGCPMAELHPELMARTKSGSLLHDAYDTFYFLNPALDEVHDLLINMYRDLLTNYDFDGIQLDYIRYPVIHGIDHSAGFEEQTKKMFLKASGIDVDTIPDTSAPEWRTFCEWRAERITTFVGRIADMISDFKAQGRNIELSTAVFGEPDAAINLKCQNWLYWTKQNWLSFISPMAYLSEPDDVYKEVHYMVENYGKVPNVAGIAPMYNHLPEIESTRQVEACRRAGAAGVAFFEATACTDSQLELLRKGVFRD